TIVTLRSSKTTDLPPTGIVLRHLGRHRPSFFLNRLVLNFLVDIKGPALAFLPVLAFEGRTRRNIPNFEAGTLLYVRVVKANPGMHPELSCTDASGKAGEFGALKEGYMFEC
ncbi:exosome complex component rrp40-like, partial [Cicer arietinum]|uniref:exosome complex component rrp40-like n=1 Tax=Cicer arietinum TaxID=3827 RepID=UPI003CC5898F